MTQTKVAITGLGAITPLGLDFQQTWEQLLLGNVGIDKISAFNPSRFSCRLAGQTPPFKINKNVPKSYRKAVKLMSRDIELAIMAANDALKSAKINTKASQQTEVSDYDPAKMAVNIGAGLISADLVELAQPVADSVTDEKFDIHKWGTSGMEALTPIWLLKYLPNMPACHIGIIHDIQGPSNTITCGEVAGHLAITEAAEMIKRDSVDIALAGGTEGKVNPIVMLRQCLLKRSNPDSNDSPKTACRPFDANASGSIFGEASGMIIMEKLAHAEKRNIKPLAFFQGWGASNSLNPQYEHLEESGQALQIAIEQAIEDANISPSQIDLIIPTGSAIPQDDKAEAKAISNALKDSAQNAITLPLKSMLSFTGAASGSLDIAVAVKAMNESTIPPAVNCENKADYVKLNIKNTKTQKDIRYSLICGYSFGGQTAAVILKNANG